jgi:hypothetical protein
MQNCRVYDIYTHSSPEIPIGDAPVTITHMSIDFFEINDGVASARGRISIMDYLERCGGEDPWVATGILKDSVFCWTVLRKTPSPTDFCFCSKGGEPLFTLSEHVNREMKKFIASKLQYVSDCLRQNPSATQVVDRPRVR